MNEAKTSQRLTYIDFMRGLACILMFQTHCYDSWLDPQARHTRFFAWSQFAATLAAPSFLFLAGVSLALAVDKMYSRGASPGLVARTTVGRGAKILLLGLLFRAQEFLLGLPKAPWTDLMRVDVLNIIGVSIMLIGITCWAARGRFSRLIAGAAGAIAIAMATPLIWTFWRPRRLPWFLESYVDGVHMFGNPPTRLFSIFPWSAFCFAGLATGTLLLLDWSRRRGDLTMALFGGGIALVGMARFFDTLTFHLYSMYDYWHTSPNFFLARVGILWAILATCYLWSRYAARQHVFTQLVQLGQNSLLVYWVHIEFVYGRFSILPKGKVGIPIASAGLAAIVAAMLILSAKRTWFRHQSIEMLRRFKEKASFANAR